MRWIKIINSFDVKFVSVYTEVSVHNFYICKMNDVCNNNNNNIDFYLAHNHESISMRCTIQISTHIQNKNKTYMQYYS